MNTYAAYHVMYGGVDPMGLEEEPASRADPRGGRGGGDAPGNLRPPLVDENWGDIITSDDFWGMTAAALVDLVSAKCYCDKRTGKWYYKNVVIGTRRQNGEYEPAKRKSDVSRIVYIRAAFYDYDTRTGSTGLYLVKSPLYNFIKEHEQQHVDNNWNAYRRLQRDIRNEVNPRHPDFNPSYEYESEHACELYKPIWLGHDIRQAWLRHAAREAAHEGEAWDGVPHKDGLSIEDAINMGGKDKGAELMADNPNAINFWKERWNKEGKFKQKIPNTKDYQGLRDYLGL